MLRNIEEIFDRNRGNLQKYRETFMAGNAFAAWGQIIVPTASCRLSQIADVRL